MYIQMLIIVTNYPLLISLNIGSSQKSSKGTRRYSVILKKAQIKAITFLKPIVSATQSLLVKDRPVSIITNVSVTT